MLRPKPIPPIAGSQAHVPAILLSMALTRLRRLLEQIPDLRSKGPDTPIYTDWRHNLEGVLTDYFGENSWQLKQFKGIRFSAVSLYSTQDEDRRAFLQGMEIAELYLKSRISELEEENQHSPDLPALTRSLETIDSRRVFVVHGHDHGTKETVARFLAQLDLEPIVLHEQPDQGRTIIEKFEDHADVGCAVVILSPDDVASPKGNPAIHEQRARQNVIFELGFFVGRLGRGHTCALVVQGVTKPSDIDGVLYIPLDGDAWKLPLVRELKAAGMDVDANKAF